ncbi:hypothetical protein N7510_009327 [Penicillium lagena]|uniref:uncharacterized protein n=1 Tax=Penicillium lagena TaxID=94218 RepID=UPI00253FF898|nr:uncharacterized protein N7510_009327 [Penicillium lagena]KAJ5606546.1 hypothetical protein N7510_009327 [Penicillium lagena]
MPRANESTSKIFYKGRSDDFIVFVDDLDILHKWRKDRSIPLSDVLNGWKIFVTHSHGAQGVLDSASNASLQNEFGTSNEDECMVKILEGGEYQASTTREREGSKNDSKGAMGVSR